ncbi:MAG: hypothetical protein U0359_14715 [Byssovorax sp.]
MIEEMERDPLVYLVGEEVGHYQGAYKVSEDISRRFGDKRAIDAHTITEQLHRHLHQRRHGRPSAHRQYMTWNFSAVAFDQILNNATRRSGRCPAASSRCRS